MAFTSKILAAGAIAAATLVTASSAAALTVIKSAVYNQGDPGGDFTPFAPLGTILATHLYETVGAGPLDKCTSAGNCTYDFTFTLSGIGPGTTVTIQATAQNSMPEVLNYDLFKGAPGATATPISSPSFVEASAPVNSVGQVIVTGLSNGAYYIQVAPSQVTVPGQIVSGSLNIAGVPEPMAWMLMLAGFGGVGVALRRKSSKPATITA